MDSIVNGIYNFVSTTVVPAVTEQASNIVGGATALAGGAAQALTQISQTALEWSSGSEDATSSSEVFSWEQQERAVVVEQKKEEEKKEEEKKPAPHIEQAGTSSSANTSVDWEMIQENPDETGPVKHNQFEIVQSDYEWMKNSK